MSDWEFLLQKEGEQAWLPLESTNVEIREGRYRIVANTHIANTEIQIRVIHDSTEEVPPVRRVHRRFSRTRSQGLVSIIPFTRLKPGIWEFRCLPQLSTSSKEAKQYIAYLQVLPTEYDNSDFSQQLEPQNQELCIAKDSQPERKNLITNENILFFPGQVDINEVKINQGKNIVKNNSELLTLEEINTEEIEFLDSQIQDQSQALFEESENLKKIPDFLDSDEQKKPNNQSQNQEFKNINNQSKELKELTETSINDSSTLGQLQQEVELKLNKETDTDTNNQTSYTANFPLGLILDRVSYIAKPGEALIISGQITLDNQNQNIQSNESFNNLPLEEKNNLKNNDSSRKENNTSIVNGSLKICLRNPQTSGILIEVQQTLPEQVLPIIFACTINVPENIKTHLILGEIILIEQKNILANTSFTITAPLENWLAAINDNDDNLVEDEHQEIVTPKASLIAIKPEQNLNSFQELVEKINQSQPDQKTEKEQFLPPQICESITGESDFESLKLPTFGNSLPENVAKDAAQIHDFLSKSNTPTDSESLKLPTFGNSLAENVAKDVTQINDFLSKSNTPADLDEVDNVWEDSEWSEGQRSLPLEEESDSETVNQEKEPETITNLVPFPTKFTPGKKEFKALKLEDRFFSKAYSLINDSELLQWMKASSLPPTEETDKDIELENISESKQKTDETDKDIELENISESKQKTEIEQLGDNDSMVDDQEFARDNDDEINWEAQEFVVEDEQVEEILLNQDQQWNFGLDNIYQGQDELIPIQSYILPDEEPLPVPHLEVLAKDVVAGRSVKVRVKLPEGLPRIYVKIWVYDRQAQAVVVGPHWLTDFIPNGMGEIEVIAELEIIYGCLEVRFEAIAAEVETNRESHKAAIEYLVAPPPPPKLPFDHLS
ncbi:MAG: hypothetical protein MGG11_19225 [Trichodesmium sp. MAG_R03]|nr:hypothetical protein [Trichodesmium sp. MAG_R03]